VRLRLRLRVDLKENQDRAVALLNELIVGVRAREVPRLADEFADSPMGIEPGQCAAQDAPMWCKTGRSIGGIVQHPTFALCPVGIAVK
jgi:hypothetical protein